MIITTVVENSAGENKELKSEHGLSFLIEDNGFKILFDTGQSGIILDNMKALGKDVSDLDYLMISHGHYDHAGGMPFLISQLASRTRIFLGAGFFDEKYRKTEEGYIDRGVSFGADELQNLEMVEDTLETEDFVIFRGFDAINDFEFIPDKFVIRKADGTYVPDGFEDEIALGMRYKDGIILIVGCSHIGIVNIMTAVAEQGYKLRGVIGGSHLVNASAERVRKTMDYVNSLNLDLVSFCHCSGADNIETMKREIKNFVPNYTGKVITLD